MNQFHGIFFEYLPFLLIYNSHFYDFLQNFREIGLQIQTNIEYLESFWCHNDTQTHDETINNHSILSNLPRFEFE